MSSFTYNPLEEEASPPSSPKYSDYSITSTRNHNGKVNTSEDAGNQRIRLESCHDINSRSDNVRYTALRPTSVTELVNNNLGLDGTDTEGTDSSILVSITSNKRNCVPKVYATICGLLIFGILLVAFGLIYVFVVIPGYKGTHFHSDPRVQSADPLKSLGDGLVKTSCGLVQGQKEKDVYVFRGIPYALPPTGSRRWKSPIAKDFYNSKCWQGIYTASAYGSKCVQPKFDDTSTIEGSEDCLYLNVWTPTLNSSTLLPVMVWFHSGDFVYGSGHIMGMSPNPQTAAATNSVYVSFNYRLGVFGFLALDDLREGPGGASGNYGFMDQLLVLKWVKTNIRQFGGNENMITVFGHASGATSIHAMLLSPISSGLFHKAWLTSPITVLNKTIDEACRDNKSFLKNTGCSNAQCLRQLPAEIVSRLSPWSLQPYWTLRQLFSMPENGQLRNDLPIFDGYIVSLRSQTTRADRPGVPVIFGSTYFDLSSLDVEQTVVNLTWNTYNDLMNQHVVGLGMDSLQEAKSLYSYTHRPDYTIPAKFPSIPSVQFLHLLGDIKNVCPVKMLADNFASLLSRSAPVYMYVAEVYPSCNIMLASSETNTFVGWDIAAFFNTFQDLNFVVGQGELNFQNILREEVISFVRSDQPDASRWKTVDVNVGVIGRDVTVTPVTSEYFSQCDLWKRYGFFQYARGKVS